jgi:teichoic acid transport system permease protein
MEWPSLDWLAFPFLLVLEIMFALSIAFVTARIGNAVVDFKNFVPFVARVWLMMSGAVFSLQSTFGSYPDWAAKLLCVNPAFSYLELSRSLLMTDYMITGPSGQDITVFCWISAILWALVPLPLAFAIFWRGEHTYGKS